MKLIYAIINKDDQESVTECLNKEGYKVTILSTTGGFFKRGNATLMICTEDENLRQVIDLIEKTCGKRRKLEYEVPCVPYSVCAGNHFIPAWFAGNKKEIETGGAVIFATDVCCYERI